jgi:putative SOS response-associated peptidase YedK
VGQGHQDRLQTDQRPQRDHPGEAVVPQGGSEKTRNPPSHGYFEWQKTEDGKKIPNYLYSEKEPLLGFAGLYEWWADPSLPEDDPARWLLSCTVLTTTTQDALGHVHDRSPVIIPGDRFAEWLDPDLTDKNDIQPLLDSLPEPTLTPRIVSTRVNSVRNNGHELIEPAE